jgi:hypothetical protein
MDAVSRAVQQKSLDHVTAVDGGPIPHEDQTTGHLPPQMLPKGDPVLRMDRTLLAGAIPLALGRDGAERREMITSPPLPHDGGVSPWGIGADDTGHRREPGCVDKTDGVLLGLRPLLMAGQVSSRQRTMAASSRWRARRAGFGGLQPIAWHQRPTWTGWEARPNARRITAAIRPQVQTCPRKPSASAPWGKSVGHRASWSAVNRRGAPGRGRCRRASGPPSRARVIHGLTAPSLTPRASAIWRWDQPCGMRCQP